MDRRWEQTHGANIAGRRLKESLIVHLLKQGSALLVAFPRLPAPVVIFAGDAAVFHTLAIGATFEPICPQPLAAGGTLS